MTKWLRSGLRRDACAVIHALGTPTGQECKTTLEDHYDDRLDSKAFYGALDALVETGHVRRVPDGIHDRYALSDAGERALLAHYEWLTECLDG